MPLKPLSNRSRAGQKHELKTLFIRVPAADWAFVTTGRQTEFRVAQGNVASAYGLEHIALPFPLFVVVYRTRPTDHKLMTLEGVRRERLIEITDEGLARAGYTGENTRERFRRDWMLREKKQYEPNRRVVVFTVRLPVIEDLPIVGANLVNHFYGDHLNGLRG